MNWQEEYNTEYCNYCRTDKGTFYIYNSPIFPKFSLYFNNIFISHEDTISKAKKVAEKYNQ